MSSIPTNPNIIGFTEDNLERTSRESIHLEVQVYITPEMTFEKEQKGFDSESFVVEFSRAAIARY